MKNNKKLVRLTESDIYSIVEDAVRQQLRENYDDEGIRDFAKRHAAKLALGGALTAGALGASIDDGTDCTGHGPDIDNSHWEEELNDYQHPEDVHYSQDYDENEPHRIAPIHHHEVEEDSWENHPDTDGDEDLDIYKNYDESMQGDFSKDPHCYDPSVDEGRRMRKPNLTESYIHNVLTNILREMIEDDNLVADITRQTIEDNIYSFMDEEGISEEEVIDAILEAFRDNIMDAPIDFMLGDLEVRIQNRENGYVSVSTDDGTGLSENYAGYPLPFSRMEDEDDIQYFIENLLSSIDEAYVASKQDEYDEFDEDDDEIDPFDYDEDY